MAEIVVALPPSSTCRVTARTHLGIAVFGLCGELDSVTAREVGDMLASALGEAAVLLDLTEISAIDASGMRVLHDVIGGVHEHGGVVAISRPWRLAGSIVSLVGVKGLVYLGLSPDGAIAWLDLHPRVGWATAVEVNFETELPLHKGAP